MVRGTECVPQWGILQQPQGLVKNQSEDSSTGQGDMNVRGLIDAFEASLIARAVAVRTREVYLQTIRSHLETVDPIHAKPAEIESWLADRNVSPNTLGQYLIRLRQFYKWVVREGHRPDNPIERLDPPKVAPNKPRPLPDQYLHAMWALAGAKERAWIALGLYCGLRASEAVAVSVEDIVDGPSLRVCGKGGRTRIVPLRPEVMDALQAVGWPRAGRFFPNAGRKTASVCIGKLLRQVGCPPLYSFHSLRHRYGTELYKASRDIRLVQELLGHASLQTTQAYVSFDDEQARWVVGRLPAMVA
jgi:site-specific recombinase XerD